MQTQNSLKFKYGIYSFLSVTFVARSFPSHFSFLALSCVATPLNTSPSLVLSAASSSLTPFSTFNYKITEMLDEKNYPGWLQRVEHVLRSYRHCVSPVPFLTKEDIALGTKNHVFTMWELQVQPFLSWLQTSPSPSLLPSVIGCHRLGNYGSVFITIFTTKSKHKRDNCEWNFLRRKEQ